MSFRFIRGFGLERVFGLDECLEIVQRTGPEDTILLDPGIDRAQGLGIQLVDPIAAFAMLANQMGPAKEAQVLRDCRPGDGKGAGDLPGGLAAAAEKIENRPAGGIGKGLESDLAGICNRTVTHNM